MANALARMHALGPTLSPRTRKRTQALPGLAGTAMALGEETLAREAHAALEKNR